MAPDRVTSVDPESRSVPSCRNQPGPLRRYTDHAWYETRDRRHLFHFSDGGVTLLNHSAMVQLLALLAWDPRASGTLA